MMASMLAGNTQQMVRSAPDSSECIPAEEDFLLGTPAQQIRPQVLIPFGHCAVLSGAVACALAGLKLS